MPAHLHPARADAVRVGLVLLFALLTYLAQDRPLRALAYLAIGLTFVAVAVVLRRRRPPARPPTRGQRLRRGALVVVALGESLALALGLVQPGDIGLLLVGVELAAAVIALTALPSVLRVVRAERSRGQTFSAALLAAAEELLPPGLVSVARFELGLWRSAYRWITPVPRAERGAVRLSYGASERLMLWVLLPCGLVELTVMDYLLRNTPLRWPLFVLGVLTVPYLLGAIARTKAQPHLLFDDRLLLRSGPDFAVEVPLAWIERASRRPQLNQGRGALRSDDGALRLAYGQQTDVRIQLDRPLLTALGPVTCIDVAVDDPHHPAVQELLTRR